MQRIVCSLATLADSSYVFYSRDRDGRRRELRTVRESPSLGPGTLSGRTA